MAKIYALFVRYVAAYSKAFLCVLAKALVLTWAFVTTWMGFTFFAVLLLLIAQYRAVQRKATIGERRWSVLKRALRDWREQLSDGFIVFVYALVVMFIVNMVRAPVLIWDEHIAAAREQARHDQKQADKADIDAEKKQAKKELGELAAKLDQARQMQPQAYLGLSLPKLAASHRDHLIRVTTEIHDFGTVSADNVATVGSVVFGAGPDAEMIEGTISPPIRFFPSDPHGFALEFGIAKTDKRRIGAILSLIDRKRPIVLTVTLYYTANGTQYSQHSVRSYDYDTKSGLILFQPLLSDARRRGHRRMLVGAAGAPGALLEGAAAAGARVVADDVAAVVAPAEAARGTVGHNHQCRDLGAVDHGVGDFAGGVHVVAVEIAIGACVRAADFGILTLDQRDRDVLLGVTSTSNRRDPARGEGRALPHAEDALLVLCGSGITGRGGGVRRGESGAGALGRTGGASGEGGDHSADYGGGKKVIGGKAI